MTKVSSFLRYFVLMMISLLGSLKGKAIVRRNLDSIPADIKLQICLMLNEINVHICIQ